MDFNETIGGGLGNAMQAYDMQAKMCSVPSMRDRLALAVRQAEEKLAAVKRAKEIFEKNPDLEELLNIMQRTHF